MELTHEEKLEVFVALVERKKAIKEDPVTRDTDAALNALENIDAVLDKIKF